MVWSSEQRPALRGTSEMKGYEGSSGSSGECRHLCWTATLCRASRGYAGANERPGQATKEEAVPMLETRVAPASSEDSPQSDENRRYEGPLVLTGVLPFCGVHCRPDGRATVKTNPIRLFSSEWDLMGPDAG